MLAERSTSLRGEPGILRRKGQSLNAGFVLCPFTLSVTLTTEASQASSSPSGVILLQIDPLVTESGVRFYGTIFIKFFETLQRKILLKTKPKTTKLLTKKDNPPWYLIPSMAQLWQMIPENPGQLYTEKQWVFLCFSTSPQKKHCSWNQWFHLKEPFPQGLCLKTQAELETKAGRGS